MRAVRARATATYGWFGAATQSSRSEGAEMSNKATPMVQRMIGEATMKCVSPDVTPAIMVGAGLAQRPDGRRWPCVRVREVGRSDMET